MDFLDSEEGKVSKDLMYGGGSFLTIIINVFDANESLQFT